MKHLETSIPGIAVIAFGVALFIMGKTTESNLSAAGLIGAGIALLRAADASKVKVPDDKP